MIVRGAQLTGRHKPPRQCGSSASATIHMSSSPASESHRALRAVAVLEAVKGLIVLAAGFGALGLIHHDVRHIAEALVTRLHIDPERHSAGVFLALAARVTDMRLWGLAALASAYSALRGAEAYGLWRNRRWAAWLGALGGAVYLPVEVYELWHKPGPVKAATLAFNVAVVAYLVWTLRRAGGARARSSV
jgi:uncharacterized membrane protein (DUF2068 family)